MFASHALQIAVKYLQSFVIYSRLFRKLTATQKYNVSLKVVSSYFTKKARSTKPKVLSSAGTVPVSSQKILSVFFGFPTEAQLAQLSSQRIASVVFGFPANFTYRSALIKATSSKRNVWHSS